jgi:hypothetical protein
MLPVLQAVECEEMEAMFVAVCCSAAAARTLMGDRKNWLRKVLPSFL